MATFKGLTIPIPALNTTVTDWYCPAVNLVMKQDIDQQGIRSAVEITKVKVGPRSIDASRIVPCSAPGP